MPQDFQADIESVNRIEAVPTILDVVCRTTGMGFAAVTRVTEDRWAVQATSAERYEQGGDWFPPFASVFTPEEACTALLRRMAGIPVRGENYAAADIATGRVGIEQAPPRVEFG